MRSIAEVIFCFKTEIHENVFGVVVVKTNNNNPNKPLEISYTYTIIIVYVANSIVYHHANT